MGQSIFLSEGVNQRLGVVNALVYLRPHSAR
jgi:hypothetical protein